MATLPTFQDVYDEVQDELTSDPEHQFADFSAGSWLDAFAGAIAITGQAVLRWIARRFLTAFVSTATGADLDFVALDRYGLVRNVGESDADFKVRIAAFIINLARATPSALLFYAENVSGVESATVVEDLINGITDINLVISSDAVAADVLQAARDGLPDWRSAGTIVNIYDVTP